MSALPLQQASLVPPAGPQPTACAGFDHRLLPRRVAEAVWRGSEIGSAQARTLATGFDLLDAELPGGGWPTHSLTEVLLPQAALCEWRLLAPALAAVARDGGQIYLVAPPKRPHAGGLAQLGVPAGQIVWIEANGPAERLWATEQLVKADPDGAVLAWLPQARAEQIRRLQVHAGSCDAPVFLMRPATAERDASAAPLRIAATLGQGWDVEVRILKRRGALFDGGLRLPAIPGALATVIPPRLRSFSALPVPLRQEASDAWALGRTAADTRRRSSVAH